LLIPTLTLLLLQHHIIIMNQFPLGNNIGNVPVAPTAGVPAAPAMGINAGMPAAAQPAGLPVAPPPAAAQLRNLPLGSEVRLTTFAQYYNEDTKDPYSRNYEHIMSRFDASLPDALPSARLFQQVVGLGSRVPQADSFCAVTPNGFPRVYCTHAPSQYIDALDGKITPWDNQSFGFLGEIVHGMVSTISFPDNAFEVVTAWVKNLDYMIQNLQEIQEIPVFPPNLPDPDDGEVSKVTTRRYMFLPHAYVPLFLNSSGYTIKQMWEVLYPVIVQKQELVSCAALINWLWVTSTGTVLANPLQMGPPVTATPLYAPPADEKLLKHRHKVLHQMLPQLLAPPASLETALNQMAAALIVQTKDSRTAREQKLALENEPKLPSARFSVTLPVLLELLQVQNEMDLPQVWHSWSNCAKRQEVQVLRDALDAFARSAEAFSTAVPLVMARLVQDLLTFQLLGQSIDDTKSGLHPFIITDGASENRHVNMEVARLYGLLTAGDATCSLADLEALSAKEVRSVPLTYWELEKSLGMFGNFIAVFLGTTHPLLVAFPELWVLLQTTVRDKLHSLLDYKRYVKPTHILRSVQLTFFTWFTHKKARLTPPNPNFKLTIQQLLRQVYVLPNLPPALYHLAYPKWQPPIPSGPLVPGLISTGSSDASGSAGSSSGGSGPGSDVSTVSGLTTPTVPPQNRGAAVINLHPNAALQTLLSANIRIKDIIGNTKPPEFDTGGEMCLAYLVRNSCVTNCRRAAQHRANLNPAEQARLEQYINAQKTVYHAKRAATVTTSSAAPSGTRG
jgi:hypothetical protein